MFHSPARLTEAILLEPMRSSDKVLVTENNEDGTEASAIELVAAAGIKEDMEKLDLDVVMLEIQPQNHPRHRKGRALSAVVQLKLGLL